MARRITSNGRGELEIRFPFDRRLVDLVKTLPGRRWNPQGRYWSVPDVHVVEVLDTLGPEGFEADGDAVDLYVRRGGGTVPGGAASAAASGGLFPEPGPAAAESADFTVSRLNETVRQVLQEAFPGSIWLVGEIQGYDKNAHRRHVSFQLVERGPDGGIVSQIQATLFESSRQVVEQRLREAGDPFAFQDEVTVRVRARVELYVPWGSYRILVEDVDPAYTLGETARRREEIVRRLAAEGLLERNPSLPLPRPPLRVGLITSLGSDAYNDVLRTLQESGFAFEVTAHGARVQGRATEATVLAALRWFADRAGDFDVVLICRGGGSRTDLAWFDSEALGRAVAAFPLPVVVGIGHEQDQCVLDAVARSAKTPTAAAAWLVAEAQSFLDEVEAAAGACLRLAAAGVAQENHRILELGRRLGSSARGRLAAASGRMDRDALRLRRAARVRLRAAREWLAASGLRLPRLAAGRALQASATLQAMAGRLLGAARRELRDAGEAARRASRALALRPVMLLRRENERIEGRRRRVELLHPRRVVERGYAILRDAAGRAVTDPGQAPAGAELVAELRGGGLALRSRGAVPASGPAGGGGGLARLGGPGGDHGETDGTEGTDIPGSGGTAGDHSPDPGRGGGGH